MNLDRPEFRLDGGENGLYGGGLGHVAGECAAIRQLGGEGLDPILVPGEQRYGVVLGGEAASECLAIAGSDAGNGANRPARDCFAHGSTPPMSCG